MNSRQVKKPVQKETTIKVQMLSDGHCIVTAKKPNTTRIYDYQREHRSKKNGKERRTSTIYGILK